MDAALTTGAAETTGAAAVVEDRAAQPTDRRWWLAVWGGAAAFVVVFGALSLRRYRDFGEQVFDFGIFDQGLWLLSRFDEPFVTFRGLNLFADHSSYLMVPLVPLYWLWANPRVLLVGTVVVIAAAAPLVFLVARGEGLGPRLSAALATAYLLAPATQWNTWDNFHPETLTLPLLIGAFACAQRRRFWWAVVLLAVALTAKEDAALVVVPFAIYLGWRWKRPREAATAAALGVLAFLVNYLVLLPHFSPTGELLYTDRYRQFGDGLLGAVVGMVTKPGQLVEQLGRIDQLAYVAAMLLPLALCLLAPEVLAIGIPITLANTLSIHHYQHELRWHYTVYLLAIVAVAAPVGARRLVQRSPGFEGRALAVAVVAVALTGSVLAGPWGLAKRDPWKGWSDNPAGVERALALVPGDAVVSADWLIGTHLAHRERIYEFPVPFEPPLSAWAAPGIPLPPTDDVEWILVTRRVVDESAEVRAALDRRRADPAFEVVVDDDAVVVLHRRSG